MNLHNTPRTIWGVWGMYKQDDLTRTAGTCNLNRIMQLSLVAWSDPKRHLYRNPKKSCFWSGQNSLRSPQYVGVMQSCRSQSSTFRRPKNPAFAVPNGIEPRKIIQDAFEWKLEHRHVWYPTEFGASRVSEYVVCHVPGMIGCDVTFWDW